MNPRKLLLGALVALACLVATASALDYHYVNPVGHRAAAVRIGGYITENGKTAQAYGSGVALDASHVLTCNHVIEDMPAPQVLVAGEQWRSATVVRRDTTWDLALLECDLPKNITSTASDSVPRIGETLESCGYGGNGYLTSNRGQVLHYASPKGNYTAQDWLEISGASRSGDSGGPMFNARGEVAAMIWGGADGVVTGTHIGRIRTFLQTADREQELFGKRRAQPTQPPAPGVNLALLHNDLQGISGKLDQIAAEKAPVATGSIVDEAARAAAANAEKGVEAIGSQVAGVSKDVGEIKQVLTPILKLHDKLEADAEAGGIKGKVAQKILDVAEGDGTDKPLRHTLITAGVVLGLVLLVAIAVIHTMRTGKGPANDIIEKLAAKHPDNERLQALHAKIDAFDAKLAGVGSKIESAAGGALGGPIGAGVPLAGDIMRQVKDLLDARLAPGLGQQGGTQAPAVTNNIQTPAAPPA